MKITKAELKKIVIEKLNVCEDPETLLTVAVNMIADALIADREALEMWKEAIKLYVSKDETIEIIP